MWTTKRKTRGTRALLLAAALAAGGAAALWLVAPALRTGLGEAADGGAGWPGGPLMTIGFMLGVTGLLLVALAAEAFMSQARRRRGR